MENSFEVDGKIYVSSKRLAKKYGYTNDHISRLCRQEKVRGQRIARTWFVDEEDLVSYQSSINGNGWGNGHQKKAVDTPARTKPATYKTLPIEETEKTSVPEEKETAPEENTPSPANRSAYSAGSAPLTSQYQFEPEETFEVLPRIQKADISQEPNENNADAEEVGEQAQNKNTHSDSLESKAIIPTATKNKSTSPGETNALFQYVSQPLRNAVLFLSILSLFSVAHAVNDPTHREALYEQTAKFVFGTEKALTRGGGIAAGEYDDALANVASIQTTTKEFVDTTALSVYHGVEEVKENTRQRILTWLGVPDGVQHAGIDTFYLGQYQLDSTDSEPQVVTETKVIERVVEKQTQGPLIAQTNGISEELLETRLQQVENELRQKIYEVRGSIPESNSVQTNFGVIAQSQKIDNLGDVTISNATISGSTISSSSFSGSEVDVSSGTFDSVNISGSLTGASATFSGALTTEGSVTFYGQPQFPSFNATSTTATSTIAGDLEIGGDLTVSGAQSFSGALTLPYFSATSTATSSSIAYRLGIGTTSPYAELSVSGNAVVTDNVMASTFTSTSTTANVFPYASTTAITTTSLFPTDIYSFTLQGDLLANGQNITNIGTATGTDLVFENATTTNATSTNLFTTLLDATTGTITNFTATDATTTNATSTNIYTQNFTADGALTLNGVGTDMLLSLNSANQLTATSTPTLSHFFATSTTATSTFAGDINVQNNAFVAQSGSGNIGIGTSSPYTDFAVAGDGAFSGNVLVEGNGTINGDTTFGLSSADTAIFNTRIGSSLTPTTDNTYDLGSTTPWRTWRTGYFGTSVAIGGTATTTGSDLTTSGAFAIDTGSTLTINATNNQDVQFGTGLVSFTHASSTRQSIFDTLYVGGTATSTLTSNALSFPNAATLDAPNGMLTLNSGALDINNTGAVTVGTDGNEQNITFETQTFDVNSTGAVTVDGTDFTYTPTGAYTVDSTGAVSIDSDASTIVSGAGVDITSDGANAVTVTYAATGGTFELTDGTTRLSFADNGSTVLGDDGATTQVDGSVITLSGDTVITGSITENITDNTTDALDVQEGSNNYINIDTTDGNETIAFGNSTTNPAYNFLSSGLFTVTGPASFSDTLSTAGLATFQSGFLSQASSTIFGLTVNGNATTTGNTTIGDATSDTITLNARVDSDIIPADNTTHDLGSSGRYWSTGYIDTLKVNNIDAASTTISGTQSSTFTINSDNNSADAEDMDLIFNRGSVNPSALISWNATTDRFDINQETLFEQGLISQASSTLFGLTISGNATTTGDQIVQGNTDLEGTLGVTGATTLSDILNVTNLATFQSGFLSQASSTIGDGTQQGGLTVSGGATTTGDQLVEGDTTLSGLLDLTGAATFGSTLTVGGNIIPDTDSTYDIGTNGTRFANIFADSFNSTAFTISGAGTDMLLSTDSSGNVVATSTPTLSHLFATSTTATSTFAGGATFATGGGNVGIGIENPDTPLAVSAGGNTFEFSPANATINAAGSGEMRLFAGGQNIFRGLDGWTSNWADSAATTYFQTGRSGGNTAFSAYLGSLYKRVSFLVDDSTAGNGFVITDDTSSAAVPNGFFEIRQDSDTPNFVLDYDGNVGIGTTSPSAQLALSDLLYVGGTGTSTIEDNLEVLGALKVGNSSLYLDNTSITNLSGDLTVNTGSNDTLINPNGGNVGIGTTDPNRNLHILSTDQDDDILIEGSGTSDPVLSFLTTGDQRLIFGIDNDDSDTFKIVDGSTLAGGDTRFAIDTNGNVGIGTTSPNKQLELSDVDGTQGIRITQQNTTYSDGDSLGALEFNTEDGSGTGAGIGAAIRAENAGGSTAPFYRLSFYNERAGRGLSDPRMVIGSSNSAGNVGIGTTSPTSKLTVNGDVDLDGGDLYLQKFGGLSGVLYATAGATGDPSIDTTKGDLFLTATDDVYIELPGTNSGRVFGIQDNTGTEIFRAQADGNVGIGTTSPDSPLHVEGDVLTTNSVNSNQIQIDSSNRNIENSNGSLFLQRFSTGHVGLAEGGGNVGVGDLTPDGLLEVSASGGASDLFMLSSDDGQDGDRLIVKNSGNVGIGTTNPGSRLQIGDNTANTSNQLILGEFDSSAEGALPVIQQKNITASEQSLALGARSTSGNIGFYTGNNTTLGSGSNALRMIINKSGNVGIGTTSPYAQLSVAGDAVIGGNLTVSGLTSTTSISAPYFTATDSSATSTFAGGINVASGGLVYDHQTGNVGIGTESPDTRFEVKGPTSTNDPLVQFTGTDTGGDIFKIVNSAGNAAFAIDNGLLQAKYWQGGDASNPAISFISDEDTGIYRGSSDTLNLVTAGSERITVGSSGNVGIGTTSPNTKLHVGGDLTLGDDANNRNTLIKHAGAGGAVITTQDNISDTAPLLDVQVYNGNSRFTVLENGNVGIGTTSPEARLDIAGSQGTMIALGPTIRKKTLDWNLSSPYDILTITSRGSDGTWRGTTNFDLSYDGGSVFTAMTLRANTDGTTANVGIGTTSPGKKLEIYDSGTSVGAGLRLTNGDGYGDIVGDNNGIDFYPNGALALTLRDSFVMLNQNLRLADNWISNDGQNEGIRIDNSGNVGIGTTSPQGKLHTSEGFSGVANIAGGSDTLILENSGNAGLTIGTPNTNQGQISFADPQNNDAGRIIYDHSDDSLRLNTITSERVRIDSSGNVGIGTTSPSRPLSVSDDGTYSAYFSGRVGIGTNEPVRALTIVDDTPFRFSATSNNRYLESNISAGSLDMYNASFSINRFSTKDVRIAQGGGDVILADGGGNVGIGTTSPYAQLSVAGDAVIGGNLTVSGLTATTSISAPYFTATDSSATSTFAGGINVASGGLVYDHQTGNVGIGTAGSSYKLDIAGTGDFIRMGSGGVNPVLARDAGGGLIIYSDGNIANTNPILDVQTSGGTSRFYVQDNGNIGIGTTSPSSNLHINTVDGASLHLSDENQPWKDIQLQAKALSSYPTDAGSHIFTTNGAGSDIFSEFGTLVIAGRDNTETGVAVGLGTGSGRKTRAWWNQNDTRFYDAAGSEIVRFDSTGNVGIGTTSPYAKLSVVGETVAEKFTATSTTATSTFAGGITVDGGAVEHDYNTGITSVDQLQLGALNFQADAGIISWVDMPVTSDAAADTVESYTAQLDGNPLLTIYGEADGSGGVKNTGVGIGTTSPYRTLSVAGDAVITGDLAFDSFTASGTPTFSDLGTDMLASINSSGELTATSTPTMSHFFATSTSATSTIAGGLNIANGGLVYDHQTGNVGIGTENADSPFHIDAGNANSGEIASYSMTTNDGLRINTYRDTAADVKFVDLIAAENSGGGNSEFRFFTVGAGSNAEERMRIGSTGNIGIGTTSPVSELSVSGTGNNLLTLHQENGNAVAIELSNTDGAWRNQIRSDESYTIAEVTSGFATPFQIESGTPSDTLYLSSTGNVGIGTTTFSGSNTKLAIEDADSGITPNAASRLTVDNSGDNGITIGAGSSNTGTLFFGDNNNGSVGRVVYDNADNSISLWTVNNERLTVGSSGNVGIGTTSPYAKLSVVGETVAENFTATSTTATSSFAGGFSVADGKIQHDVGAGVTSIETLNLGATSFDDDAGQVSWIDLPITSSAPAGRIQSYTAQIDANSVLTVYGEADGSGGAQNLRVGIGTTSPYKTLSVAGDAVITGDLTFDNFTASGTPTFSNLGTDMLTAINSNGELVATSTPTASHYFATSTTATSTFAGGATFATGGGNVGIGTTSPREKLEVTGNLRLTNNILSPESVTFDSETSDGLRLTNDNGYISLTPLNAGWAHIYTDRSDFIFNRPVYSIDNKFSSYSTGDLELQTGGTTRITAQSSTGNVGIGTTSPVDTLSLTSDKPRITLHDNDGGIQDTWQLGVNFTETIGGTENWGDFGIWNQSRNEGLMIEYNTGEVGIGTTSPATELDVYGDVRATNGVVQSYSDDGTPYIFTMDAIDGTGPRLKLGTQSNMSSFFEIGAYSSINNFDTKGRDLRFLSSSVDPILYMKEDTGNVGIGTTSPDKKLTVEGGDIKVKSADADLYFEETTGGTTGRISLDSSGRMAFRVNSENVTRMVIDNNGNVGIGTTSPLAKLDVYGNGILSGANRYLNFNNTVGSGGYGFRDSSGTMQFKNSGGTWTDVGSGSGGGSSFAWDTRDYGVATTTTLGFEGGFLSTASSTINANLHLGSNSIWDNTNGRLGIGTTSPYAKFAVQQENETQPRFTVGSSTATNFLVDAGGDTDIGGKSWVNEFATVEINGGTSGTALYIANSSGNGIRFQGTDTTSRIDSLTSLGGSHPLQIDASTISLRYNDGTGEEVGLFLNTAGNIGISSTTPSSTLSVDGSTWLNSNVINFASTSASTLTVNYKSAATSTIPDSQKYAWSIATSTDAHPIFSIDTSGTDGGSGTATTSVRGSVSIDEGRFQHDSGAGVTSIEKLNLGPQSFDSDAGKVSWIDLPVTSSAATGTPQAFSAQLDSNQLFTVYGQANGSGALNKARVLVGTSTDTILGSSNIPFGSLLVADGALCVDNGEAANCDDSALSSGQIYAESSSVTAIDVAENYPTKDSDLKEGELVMFDEENEVFVKRYDRTQMYTDGASSTEETRIDTDIRDAFAGVVSTDPGVLLGGFGNDEFSGESKVPIALTGRVPVLVNGEGGAIKPGDRISFSSTPGVGTRATTSGITVGVALESFNTASSTATSTVMTYVDSEYHFAPNQFAIDREGNVAFGTTTDSAYRVKVDGDVAATGFVNISASSTKANIKEVSAEEKEGMLKKLRGMFVATYRYDRDEYMNSSTTNATTSDRLGLIAERAPEEVLSSDGKGVDLYKFVTFVASAVQSLADTVDKIVEKVKGNDDRIAELEKRILELESRAGIANASSTQTTTAENPVITINGNNPAYVEVGASYNDLGASVTDDRDDNLGVKASVNGEDVGDQSNVSIDTSTSTTHEIEYRATDNDGNTGTAVRTVVVGSGINGEDTTDDTTDTSTTTDSTIDGTTDTSTTTDSTTDTATTTDPVSTDTESSASADDTGESQSEPTTNGTGTSTSTPETTEPEDTTAPEITLDGSTNMELTVGDTYTEPGYSATDDTDGDITSDVVVGGDTVDTSTAGTYTKTYNVTDQAGNTATEKTRTITVVEPIDTTDSTDTATTTSETTDTASSTDQS